MKHSKLTIFNLVLAAAATIILTIYISRYYDLRNSYEDYAKVQLTIAPALEKASQAVVAIQTTVNDNSLVTTKTQGSGFIFDSDGHILTNEHVIHLADRIEVTLADKTKYLARLIGSDVRMDIAVIKIDKDNLTHLELGGQSQLQVGQLAVAMGNPLGTGADGKAVTAFGRIIRLSQTLDPLIDPANDRFLDNLIQTDARTLPGNSGGPLIDKSGRAIGVTAAMGSGIETGRLFGFAITMDEPTIALVKLLKQGKSLSHGFMGISLLDQVDDDLVDRLGVSDISGAMVRSAMLGSPAQQAGVAPGDFIKAIDNQRIYSDVDLLSYLNRRRPGQKVELKFLRLVNGKSREMTVSMSLAKRSVADRRGYSEEERLQTFEVWGMSVKALTDWRKANLQLPANQGGVLIFHVEPADKSQQAGLEAGNVITALSNQPINSIRDFISYINKNPGPMPKVTALKMSPGLTRELEE